MRPVAIALLATALSAVAACGANADDLRWIDQALLHDGRTIDVERTVVRHFGGGEPSNAIMRWPDQYTLETRNPDTREAVRWNGPRHFNPILIDFVDKAAYLVIVQAGLDADLSQYGCPELPYIFLRQEGGGARWKQIPRGEFPRALVHANLSFAYDGIVKGKLRQSKDDIERGNATIEASSGHLLAREIPADFAAWRFSHKNEYRLSHYQDGCRHAVPSNVDSGHPQSRGYPSREVDLEILATTVHEPERVIKGAYADPGHNWPAISWDEGRYAKCKSFVKRVDDGADKPELRGWLLFVGDKTGTKKAREVSQMFCDDRALWFPDYTVEPGRTVITKFSTAGDFIYRLSFAKPDAPGGFVGSILQPTFRNEDGYLTFEWWNANQSGYDWKVRRVMKVRVPEPAAR